MLRQQRAQLAAPVPLTGGRAVCADPQGASLLAATRLALQARQVSVEEAARQLLAFLQRRERVGQQPASSFRHGISLASSPGWESSSIPSALENGYDTARTSVDSEWAMSGVSMGAIQESAVAEHQSGAYVSGAAQQHSEALPRRAARSSSRFQFAQEANDAYGATSYSATNGSTSSALYNAGYGMHTLT